MKTIIAAIFLSTAAFAQSKENSNRLTLTAKLFNQLAEEARTNYPGMRAAESRLRAAEKNQGTVRLFDDPEVSFGGMLGNGVMRKEEGDLVYGLEQKLPLTGKPQAEKKMAAAGREVEEAARDLRFQTLRRDVAQAAIRAALADEVLRISRQDQAWVETMVTATSERYQAGRATQVETLRMETEHAARAEQLRVASKNRESELLILNRLLNRPLTNVWPELELPKLAPLLAPSERLVELATAHEPRLRMMRHEIARAEASAETARRAKRPDFSIGADARQYAGDGEFKEGTIFFKMTIPWINKAKYDAAFHREKDRAEAAGWDAAEYEAQLRDETSRLIIRIENARRQALLYRDSIIPRSEQALSSAQGTWQSGKAFFHDVLESRRLLLEGRLNYARAVADQYLALSELVLCCGIADMDATELYLKLNEQEK